LAFPHYPQNVDSCSIQHPVQKYRLLMSKPTVHRRVFGQFFTPLEVVACCYGLLNGKLSSAPHIVDPACGDGAFLRYATEQNLAPRTHLYGCDIDPPLAAMTAVDLPNVRCADGLDEASLQAGAFDLVVGNPPFGVVTSPVDGLPRISEVRFLLRAIELARPGGFVALVLPSGVLANERLRAVRAAALRECTALAVIALPRSAFRLTGTYAQCSIVVLQKVSAPADHQVFFGIAEQLDDLPGLVAAYQGSGVRGQGSGVRAGERGSGGAGETQDVIRKTQDVIRATHHAPRTTHDHRQPTTNHYRLPQTDALAQRMDAHFWRPECLQLLERMAARFELKQLGELIDRRSQLFVGDHVRASRGEAKAPGLPYEYYQTREFMAAGYNYAALERCDERAYRRLKRTAVQRHDILISCAGVGGSGLGRVCLVTHQPGLSCTGDVFALRTSDPHPIFLFLFLISHSGRAQLLRLQNGVGTSNLSADELLQVFVPLLPPDVQRDLANRYAPIATAHDQAMAACIRGDTAMFQRERTHAEALLAELVAHVEALCACTRLEIGD
jgi:predicted RNA methylase